MDLTYGEGGSSSVNSASRGRGGFPRGGGGRTQGGRGQRTMAVVDAEASTTLTVHHLPKMTIALCARYATKRGTLLKNAGTGLMKTTCRIRSWLQLP
jgi:class 3 adenylate cyclase